MSQSAYAKNRPFYVCGYVGKFLSSPKLFLGRVEATMAESKVGIFQMFMSFTFNCNNNT